MPGKMIDFDATESTASGYLAVPDTSSGQKTPGVIVLHAWWGLTEPFRQVCDRLAEAGFMALAPDLYHGESTATVERAQELGAALDEQVDRWQGDITGALRYLHQHGATTSTGDAKFAFIGFSLGGAYALDMSVNLADEIAAAVIFYDTFPGLDYEHAKAAYLCHYAEDDSFVSPESVAAMEQGLQAAGRRANIYTYPGTKHWFFEANRPDAYDADAAALAWERTLAFLNVELRG